MLIESSCSYNPFFSVVEFVRQEKVKSVVNYVALAVLFALVVYQVWVGGVFSRKFEKEDDEEIELPEDFDGRDLEQNEDSGTQFDQFSLSAQLNYPYDQSVVNSNQSVKRVLKPSTGQSGRLEGDQLNDLLAGFRSRR